MEDMDICLLLKASLDAAFRGKSFSGPEKIRAWGEEVVSLLREGFQNIVNRILSLKDNSEMSRSTASSTVPGLRNGVRFGPAKQRSLISM